MCVFVGLCDYSHSDVRPWSVSSSSGAGARLLRSLPRLEWLSDRKLAREGLLRMECRGVRAILPLDSDRTDQGEGGNVEVKNRPIFQIDNFLTYIYNMKATVLGTVELLGVSL